MVPLSGCAVVTLLWLEHASLALAQTDEIQVYDAAIAGISAWIAGIWYLQLSM